MTELYAKEEPAQQIVIYDFTLKAINKENISIKICDNT